jgi:hypothetical protein
MGLGLLLAHSRHIRSLILIDCQIESKGAKSIAEGLVHSPSLLTLDLSHNQKIGDLGAMAIATAVKGCPSLTHLNLEACGIQSGGASALASALPFLACPLTDLNLARNPLGNEGFTHLGQGLMEAEKGCPIKRLRLSKCGLSRLQGVLGFSVGLHPDCLEEIDLSGNPLNTTEEADSIRVIADALKGNFRLRKLVVGGRTLTVGAINGLKELLSRISQQGCQQLQICIEGTIAIGHSTVNR